jgi:4,5-dihydroxyphthalate decarboxylase
LEAGVDLSDAEQVLAQRRHLVGADPLPYGLAANDTALEAVIQFAVDQHILPRRVNLDEVFASNTLDLA